MFAVPTQLREYNQIIVKGYMTDGKLDIALSPDGNQDNIVCRLRIDFPVDDQSNDQIIVSYVQNGKTTTFSDSKQATSYFYDLDFEVRFTLLSRAISIMTPESPLESIPLENSLDDIKFILVKGRVDELGFRFAD